jgi:hypothetical protein
MSEEETCEIQLSKETLARLVNEANKRAISIDEYICLILKEEMDKAEKET